MVERIAANWRMVLTAAILVGLAALALAKGVSVLAEDRQVAGGQTVEGQPRQVVQAPTAEQASQPVQANQPAQEVRAADSTLAAAGAGVQASAPTPQAPGGTTYHTVQSGETLGKIATKYGVTTAAVAKANNITNPDVIRVGQRLTIPAH
jgi:LysM repeat protein